MGLFRGFTEGQLLRDEQGRAILRPWGNWGDAYILTAQREEEMHRLGARIWIVFLAAVVVVTMTVGWRWAFVVLLPSALVAHFVMWKKVTAGMERAASIPQFRRVEHLQRASRAYGRPLLWTMLIVSLAFVAVGVLLMEDGGGLSAWLPIVFFGACAISIGAQLWLAYRQRGD